MEQQLRSKSNNDRLTHVRLAMCHRWRSGMIRGTGTGMHRGTVAVVCAATMVVAVGCSSGATGQNAGGGNSLAPVQDKSDATNAVTDYLGYVKGKAGAANPTLSPISIGWVNQQGGTQDSPEATNA